MQPHRDLNEERAVSSVHEPIYQRLLHRLRLARFEAGLTQIEVAEKLKKPQPYVSKCESGERRMDVIELKSFADIYGKTLDYFVADS